MGCVVESIGINRLIGHPDNPNRMSKAKFGKLVRNIQRSGLYEPLVVRRHREGQGCFEIINGHHRYEALKKLGYERIDCVVWDVSDEQVDVLLLTLNRLSGSDEASKKVSLLRRVNDRMELDKMAKLLPATGKQIERLIHLNGGIRVQRLAAEGFARAVVFFVDERQEAIIEKALSSVDGVGEGGSKACRRAAALVVISEKYLKS